MIDIILTNPERLLLREVELSIAPTNLAGAFKRIRRDPARDQYVATLNKAEIAQLAACIRGNTIYLAQVPSHKCIPGLVRKLTGFTAILAPPLKTVEV